MRHGSLAGGRKPIRDLPQELRQVKRGLWGDQRVYGVAAVDLLFRMHFYLRRLPVRRSSRRSFSTGGKKYAALKKGELSHDDKLILRNYSIRWIPTGEPLIICRLTAANREPARLE